MAETIVKDSFLGSTSPRRRRGRGTPAATAAAPDSALAGPIARFQSPTTRPDHHFDASSLRSDRPAVVWHRVAATELDELTASRLDVDGQDVTDRSPTPTPARRTQRHVPGWLVAILALAAGMAIGIVLRPSPEAPSVDNAAQLQACSQALDVAKERALLSVTRSASETRMLVAVNESDFDALRLELSRLAELREEDVEKGQRFNELRTHCER